jgi:hypothetical protein
MKTATRVFLSYSHDSPAHKQWVLKLAADLRVYGVDAIIDQWDLSPGEDIPTFMEHALKSSDRVVVVCSGRYVERANTGKGGVGYEKMIVTAELIEDLGSKKFIPIVRNAKIPPVPTFLGYRLYIDFEDDAKYPSSLETLLRELLNVPNPGKPPLGSSPFDSEGQGAVGLGTLPLLPSSDPGGQSEEVKPNVAVTRPTITQLKKVLAEPAHALRLHELVMPIAAEARRMLESAEITNYLVHPTKESLLERISSANQATALLEHVFAVGCHWADSAQSKIFARALSRVTIVPKPTGTFYDVWEKVVRYPSLRVMYAGAISALAAGSYSTLRQLMIETKSKTRVHEPDDALVVVLHHGAAFAQDYWKWLPEMDRHYVPVSDYLEETLRPALREVVSDDEELAVLFDRFEFFQALVYGDLKGSKRDFGFWAPLGAFIWRRRDLFQLVRDEIKREGRAWRPLQAGFFGGDQERALTMVTSLEEFTGRVRGQLGIW